MISPCESATATTTVFCISAVFSTIRSTILRASAYSMTGTVFIGIGREDESKPIHYDRRIPLRRYTRRDFYATNEKSRTGREPSPAVEAQLEDEFNRELN